MLPSDDSSSRSDRPCMRTDPVCGCIRHISPINQGIAGEAVWCPPANSTGTGSSTAPVAQQRLCAVRVYRKLCCKRERLSRSATDLVVSGQQQGSSPGVVLAMVGNAESGAALR